MTCYFRPHTTPRISLRVSGPAKHAKMAFEVPLVSMRESPRVEGCVRADLLHNQPLNVFESRPWIGVGSVFGLNTPHRVLCRERDRWHEPLAVLKNRINHVVSTMDWSRDNLSSPSSATPSMHLSCL